MGTSELESLLAEKQKLLTDLSQEEKNLLQLEQSGEDAQMDAPLVFHKDAKKDAQKDALKDAEGKQNKQKISPSQKSKSQGKYKKSYLFSTRIHILLRLECSYNCLA